MNNFGYPINCSLCSETTDCPVENLQLNVEPYFQKGNDFRLMLIGQDPTISNKEKNVSKVLMLDEPNGQLKRWLKVMIGENDYDKITIYATNLVKCTFPQKPSLYKGKVFLLPYFNNCKGYLKDEVLNYKPNLVLTFGEPAHRYFSSMFDNEASINKSMKFAFGVDENFFLAEIEGLKFSYSPSLHIQTFRVAETYGKKVQSYKQSLLNEISKKFK